MGKKTFVKSTKKPFKKHKRNALKGFAGGATFALVSYWERPIVQSIILPAHAATTAQNGVPPPEDAPFSIENLMVEGPDGPTSCNIFTLTEPFWGGCAAVQYSFNFASFTDFSDSTLTVTGPVGGTNTQIYNTSSPRASGTDSGTTHTVVAAGIPFAIPGDYIFEVTAFTFAVAAVRFSFIRTAYAQSKKKSSKKRTKKKVA